MARALTFTAADDKIRAWPLPKHASPHLILRAVDKVATGGDEAIAEMGLTLAETTLVAEIVAWLEEHQRAEAVA